MITVTTQSLNDRLKKSFTGVKEFVPFDASILNASSVTSRTVTVINHEGVSMIVQVYTTGTEAEISNETAEWKRVVIMAHHNMAFYF